MFILDLDGVKEMEAGAGIPCAANQGTFAKSLRLVVELINDILLNLDREQPWEGKDMWFRDGHREEIWACCPGEDGGW